MKVKCLINRFWGPDRLNRDGEWLFGTLIDVSTQTAGDSSGRLIPVGIVLLDDDNTFQCVPMEFIEKG